MPRISQLTALTSPDSSDELAIVDASTATTKKITRTDLLAGSPLPANTVDSQAIDDEAVTARTIDFSTLAGNTTLLNTALNPITTTPTSVGSISVPDTGNYLIIANPAVNWNNAALNTFRGEIYNLTTTTLLAQRVISYGPGDYINTFTVVTIAALNAGATIQVRYRVDSGSAGLNYTAAPGSLSLIRIGSKT